MTAMGFPTPTSTWTDAPTPRGHHTCERCGGDLWWDHGYVAPLNVVRGRVAGPHTAQQCRYRAGRRD